MKSSMVAALLLAITLLAAGVADSFAFLGFGGSKGKSPLSDEQRATAREILRDLPGEVRLAYFSGDDCRKCDRAGRFFSEIADLSLKISCETLSLEESADRAGALGVDRAPVAALMTSEGGDTGIRYYGTPLGYEFETFLHALRWTAGEAPALSAESTARLREATEPATVTVFVVEH